MRKFHLLFLAASTAVLFLVSPFCALGNTSSVVLTTQDSGTKVTLLDTYFLSIEKGRAVGERGTVLQTEDGGATWEFRSNENGRPMYFSQIRVSTEDPNLVYTVDQQVAKSRDGGQTW